MPPLLKPTGIEPLMVVACALFRFKNLPRPRDESARGHRMGKAPPSAFTRGPLQVVTQIIIEPGKLIAMVVMNKTFIQIDGLITALSPLFYRMQVRMALLADVRLLSQRTGFFLGPRIAKAHSIEMLLDRSCRNRTS